MKGAWIPMLPRGGTWVKTEGLSPTRKSGETREHTSITHLRKGRAGVFVLELPSIIGCSWVCDLPEISSLLCRQAKKKPSGPQVRVLLVESGSIPLVQMEVRTKGREWGTDSTGLCPYISHHGRAWVSDGFGPLFTSGSYL